MWRDDIVTEAKSWLGTPYHPMARLKDVGVDCAHLIIGVYGNCGLIEPFDPGTYSPEWHLHRSEEKYKQGIESYCVPIDIGEILPGDIMLYQFGRCASHGAIYIGNGEIIHAYVGYGVIQTRYDAAILYKPNGKLRLVACYRWKGGE